MNCAFLIDKTTITLPESVEVTSNVLLFTVNIYDILLRKLKTIHF